MSKLGDGGRLTFTGGRAWPWAQSRAGLNSASASVTNSGVRDRSRSMRFLPLPRAWRGPRLPRAGAVHLTQLRHSVIEALINMAVTNRQARRRWPLALMVLAALLPAACGR